MVSVFVVKLSCTSPLSPSYPNISMSTDNTEIGAWTWNWMEPLTGTLSFTLLTLQFAR